MIGRLWFAPFNGAAAVSFFFVLSGFVLPWNYYNSGELGLVARGALKRWPRLAGACTLTTLLSWLLFVVGGYHFALAGEISGSPWLKDFGYAGLPPGFQPQFWPSLFQGAFLTFFDGEAYLNSSLWTMRPEIVGSMVVLGVAPVLLHLRSTLAIVWATVGLGLVLVNAEPHIPQFLAGALLARLLSGRQLHLSRWLALGLIAIAFLLFSFDGPTGAFSWLKPTGLVAWQWYPVVWVPASLLLIVAAVCCPQVYRLLSGRWARLLGRLSFPIYLVHLPVICSLGAWTYIQLVPLVPLRVAVLSTAVAVLIGTFACAFVVGMFDRWWVARINRAAGSRR